MDLANSGHTTQAIGVLTGIQRGDAAFDFSYFDAEISQQTAHHKQVFDQSTRDALGLLTGWVYIPIVAMGLVLVGTALAARRRLQEYR